MSGIANVIPGADFSNSPLGQVSFIKTHDEMAEDVVNTYAASIGDTTYNSQLKIMVKTLMDLEAWDGLDIYPMLGSSLAHKKVNLNPEKGLNKSNLILGTNATDTTDGIVFEKVADAGESISNYAQNLVPLSDGALFITDIIRSSSVIGNCGLYCSYNATTPTSRIMLASASNSKFNGSYSYVNYAYHQYTDLLTTTRRMFMYSVGPNKLKIYVDGTLSKETDSPSQTDANVSMVNYLGAAPSSADPEYSQAAYSFNGTCRLWAMGRVAVSKHEDVCATIKTFMDAVKPNS